MTINAIKKSTKNDLSVKPVKNSEAESKIVKIIESPESQLFGPMKRAYSRVLRRFKEANIALLDFEESYPRQFIDYPYKAWVWSSFDELSAIKAARQRCLNDFFTMCLVNSPLNPSIDRFGFIELVQNGPYNEKRSISIFRKEYLEIASDVRDIIADKPYIEEVKR